MLTLRCNAIEVFEAGVIKEIIDIFGPGNAETKDLTANSVGIKLGLELYYSNQASDDLCMEKCKEYF